MNGQIRVRVMIPNRFPLYIPSKGRHEYMITSKALTEMGICHFVVVEPDQADDYKKAIKYFNLLSEVVVMDLDYKNQYELCDNLGLSKSTGPGPARNFALDHSIKNGHSWHWVMDDNIKDFRRMASGGRIKCISKSFFAAMEDFVLRYKNIAMAGPDYTMFAFSSAKQPPFVTNTRIYSCNLIRNDTGFRWRGRYNEDTILSLDMLSAGWCTVQFNAFLQTKMATQTIKGGNTDEFYHKEGILKDGDRYADKGTDAKSLMLFNVYPQFTKIIKRFGRTHHKVNYNSFKKQKLIRNNEPIKSIDYGFNLIKKVK